MPPVTTTAVLFDLDDTLFDHWGCTRVALGALQASHDAFGAWPFEAFESAHRQLLEALHLEVLAGRLTVDDARLQRFRRLFEQAGGDASEALARAAAAEYRERYVEAWRPVSGALELLQALHGRVALGVVTNNVAGEQRMKIDACGFGPLLDAVVISEEAGVAKPDPRIFELALATLGRAPEAAVMVGDAWGTDIAGARAASIRPVWFNRFGAVSPDPSVQEITSLAPVDAASALILGAERVDAVAKPSESRSRIPQSPIPNPQSR